MYLRDGSVQAIVRADQTFYLTPSQYTDTGQTQLMNDRRTDTHSVSYLQRDI